MEPTRPRVLRGALAGAAAAAVWAAQEPLDQRVFRVPYSDPELLGTWVTRGRAAAPVGLLVHLQNGALVGGAYAALAPRLPGPRWLGGVAVGLGEHLATWPGTALLPRMHPLGAELPALWGSGRAFAQATWRHLLFGVVLGVLEQQLNAPSAPAPPTAAMSARNGRGSPQHLSTAP
jgi:ABC-type Fe3+-siderophore transport system permease subunit